MAIPELPFVLGAGAVVNPGITRTVSDTVVTSDSVARSPLVLVRTASDTVRATDSVARLVNSLPAVGSGVPTVGVLIDWANDGNFTGTYDDITADVGGQDAGAIALSITAGGAADFGSGLSSGGCTIIVRNDTNKYSIDNGASPLTGNLKVGRPVWVTAVYLGLTYGLFAGYIERIVPDPRTKMATIICGDPMRRFARLEVQVTDSTTRNMAEYRGAILDAMGELSTQRTLAVEPDIPPYSGNRVASALSLLGEINQSTLSRHYIKPGNAMPDWYYYTVRDRHYGLDGVTVATIVDGDLADMDGYELSHDTLTNTAYVAPTARVLAASGVIWNYPELPLAIPAGTSRTVWADLSDPAVDVSATYTATGSPTVTLTSLGTSVKIVVTAGATDSLFSAFSLVGRAALLTSGIRVTASDATSVATYDAYTTEVTATLLATTGQAQGIADHLVYRFKDPRTRPSVTLESRFPTMLAVDLFQSIVLTFDRLAIVSKRFEVTGKQLDITADRLRWFASWHLQESPAGVTFFRVGGSAAEGVGGVGILAY